MSWLERRPVFATVLTGLGVAMLAVGLFCLAAPAATLDKLWALGDGRLAFLSLVVLVGAMALTMVVAALIELARRASAPPVEAPPPPEKPSETQRTQG